MNAREKALAPVDAPAPWSLRGQGYIWAVWMPKTQLDQASFLDKSLRASRRGRIGYVMFVDYAESGVGPYHELLFIPGSVDFSGTRKRTISKIYVSSQASVEAGRRNWGIPKERCDFRVHYGDDGVDRVAASLNGKTFAEFEFSVRGPRLPVNGALAPRFLRTLAQRLDGKDFFYTPSARGHVRLASLAKARVNPKRFPDLASGRVLAALKVTDFAMVFPEARIAPTGSR